MPWVGDWTCHSDDTSIKQTVTFRAANEIAAGRASKVEASGTQLS